MVLFKLILNYYRCCSLCLFTVEATSSRWLRIGLIVWPFIHIILLSTITILIRCYSKFVFFDGDLIGILTDVIQIAAPFCAHFIVIIVSLCSLWQQTKIWHLHGKIDVALMSLRFNVDQYTTTAIRQYFRKSFATYCICFAIEMRIIVYIGQNNIWRNHWLASIYSLIVCRSFHLWYILYVDYVSCRIEIINMELIRIGNRHNLLRLRNSNDSAATVREIRVLKRVYSRLWKIGDLMEQSFGWAQLATVTSDFVRCTVNLYWNYAAYYFGTNPYWKESLMSSCPIIITFLVLLYSCEKCENKVFGRILSGFDGLYMYIVYVSFHFRQNG